MSRVNHEATSHYIEELQAAGWKQKIGYLNGLAQQVKLDQMPLSPQLLENIWPDLIQENNLNVLQKAVSTLRTWVEAYGIKSIRLQRELVKSLIGLAKMGKCEVNQDVISIVVTLYSLENQGNQACQRVPLMLLDRGRFNSSNNPTFLMGLQQSDTMQEQGSDKQQEAVPQQENFQTSLILAIVAESMKTCRKRSFDLCLKIIIALHQKELLSRNQFSELLDQVNEISVVIQHRKTPCKDLGGMDARLAEEINSLVEELRNLEK